MKASPSPTPGWEPSLGGFPALSALPGQFLLKDVVLLGASLFTAGESLEAAGEQQPDHQRAQLGRESEAAGKDESWERPVADRVGEEGQAAEHDPGAKQPGGEGQQDDLGQAALHEREQEGFQHRQRTAGPLGPAGGTDRRRSVARPSASR